MDIKINPYGLSRRRRIACSLIVAAAGASHVLYAAGAWVAVVPVPVW